MFRHNNRVQYKMQIDFSLQIHQFTNNVHFTSMNTVWRQFWTNKGTLDHCNYYYNPILLGNVINVRLLGGGGAKLIKK